MPIPDYQALMLPLLKFTGDGEEHTVREAVEFLGKQFDLTEEDLAELLPGGHHSVFINRLSWARIHLGKAGLLENTRRGFFKITPKGAATLKQKPKQIDGKFLDQFQEYRNFKMLRRQRTATESASVVELSATPDEIMEQTSQTLQCNLAQEILILIKQMHPGMFERLVVDLLLKMGYGGNHKDAGRALGKSGDEGIDGVISEDKLGLEKIYIQAKRWEDTVGRPEVQKFAGALHGKRAKKGVFITTSDFSREAREYVGQIDIRIVLIDGEELAQRLIDHDLGVSTVATYRIKRLDSDYFSEG